MYFELLQGILSKNSYFARVIRHGAKPDPFGTGRQMDPHNNPFQSPVMEHQLPPQRVWTMEGAAQKRDRKKGCPSFCLSFFIKNDTASPRSSSSPYQS
jgi:hypothetical protein